MKIPSPELSTDWKEWARSVELEAQKPVQADALRPVVFDINNLPSAVLNGIIIMTVNNAGDHIPMWSSGGTWHFALGGFGSIRNITRIDNTDSPYTALSTDYNIFADTDGGAITILLPEGIEGTEYRVVNVGTSSNLLTVTPDGTEKLLGVNASKTANDGTVVVLAYETTEGWW